LSESAGKAPEKRKKRGRLFRALVRRFKNRCGFIATAPRGFKFRGKI